MNWSKWWGGKEKDPRLDMSLEDYLAKYPTLDKRGIKATEVEKHASAAIDIDGHKMLVYKGNITQLHIDAIQNAANSTLMGGGGIDGAIHDGAGYSLHDECKELGGCPTGESKITKGYDLPSATIIHTVGPIYSNHSPGKCSHQLQSCYKTTLELCDKYRLKSVGLCCVSCGIFGYPLDKATHIAFDTVLNYLKENNQTSLEYVIFVVFLPRELQVYKEIFEKYNSGKYEKPILPPIETPELIARRKKMEELERLDERIKTKENELKELKEKREKLENELKKEEEKDKEEETKKVEGKEKEKKVEKMEIETDKEKTEDGKIIIDEEEDKKEVKETETVKVEKMEEETDKEKTEDGKIIIDDEEDKKEEVKNKETVKVEKMEIETDNNTEKEKDNKTNVVENKEVETTK